jgi:arsenical pump membrane protein
MSSAVQLYATLALFAATLVAVLRRPFGLGEGWWTCLGGGLALLLGWVTPAQARTTLLAGHEALLFLLGLLVLSTLLEESGFFEWAALTSAHASQGNGRRLFRNTFLLGAAVTMVLSLDTTAVLVTPVILSTLRRVKLPAKAHVLACALVANIASLLLPISNLTNLIFAQDFHFSFAAFASRMAFPQVVSLGVTYAALRFLFRGDLRTDFEPSELPVAQESIRSPIFFRGACWILVGVLAGYFVGPRVGVPPYVFALGGAALLGGWGALVSGLRWSWIRNVSWGVFPFVVGLFVLVQAVENLGFTEGLAHGLQVARAHHLGLWAATGGAALGSNLLNNLPTALLTRSLLQTAHSPPPEIYGALLGTNIGSSATLFGSLATLLVLTKARERGESIRTWDFLCTSVSVTTVALIAASAALALTFWIHP